MVYTCIILLVDFLCYRTKFIISDGCDTQGDFYFFPEIRFLTDDVPLLYFFQMYADAGEDELPGEGEAGARQHPRTRPIRCAHPAERGEQNR